MTISWRSDSPPQVPQVLSKDKTLVWDFKEQMGHPYLLNAGRREKNISIKVERKMLTRKSCEITKRYKRYHGTLVAKKNNSRMKRWRIMRQDIADTAHLMRKDKLHIDCDIRSTKNIYISFSHINSLILTRERERGKKQILLE